MSLQPGARLGPYEVHSLIGAGGMGEVYRARDTKLNRHVAIKVLPDLFTTDPDRLARFRREAQVLASLNHPNIGHIYGIEEHAIILELVEGRTLADRIAQGPLRLADALAIARQIADALECAHEHDIVHRDLKPANIKIRDDGTVKVLDFGLAKALDADDVSNVETMPSPALTGPVTGSGVVIGTAAYMSPEQAAGTAVDKRADIWAFGVILYEMLSGRRPFEGHGVSLTLASVLRDTPDWNTLPEDLPPVVQWVVRRCLEKDPRRRLSAIGDARVNVEDVTQPRVVGVPGRSSHRPRSPFKSWVFGAMAAATLTLATFTLWWAWKRPPVEHSSQVGRFELTFPVGHEFQMPGGVSVSISPNGRRLVYVGRSQSSGQQLWLRSLDQVDATPIAGTQGALNPVFSPDGESVAYLTLGPTTLKVVSLAGSPPLTLVADSISQFALDWGPDDRLYFNRPDGRIARIPSAGGTAEDLISPDAKAGEVFYRWVDVLPNGRGALFTIWRGFAEYDIGVTSFETGKSRVLFKGMMARYASSGHVLFVDADGTLSAVPFDAARLEVEGPATPLIKGVALDGALGAFQFAVSESGTLLYVPGEGGDKFQPTWVRHDGQERPIDIVFRTLCRCLALSPDGKRIAAAHRGETATADDIWVYDLEQRGFSRVTVEESSEYRPFWSFDGERIGFVSNRNKTQSLYAVSRDGSGPVAEIASSPERIWEGEWSPEGTLIYRQGTFGKRSIQFRPAHAGSSAEPFIDTAFDELMPTFSPNGRWVAYVSNESGQDEVYVRPFRGAGGRWKISTGGGVEPVWAHSGRELFYRRPTREMVAVRVRTDPAFEVGPQSVLFSGRDFPPADSHQGYDVSPDDKEFLMLKRVQRAQSAPVVVLGWFEEIRQKIR